VHHLHLPDILDSDGFVRRDPALDADLLLFAIFRNDRAYLLDVLSHGDWTNESLVEIAVRNWPGDRLFVSLQGAVGISQTLQQGDRQKLRSAGVNSLIQIDGEVYISASGGLTAAGTVV
jgi:hypothetical protein